MNKAKSYGMLDHCTPAENSQERDGPAFHKCKKYAIDQYKLVVIGKSTVLPLLNRLAPLFHQDAFIR